jgi:pectin methylesterase-like acyl-CoA thioesterase
VDDSNPCPGAGTAGDPYCSIQLAIDAANTTGDTIVVKPGTYTECLNADPKAIVLQAENPDPNQTVLTASPARASPCSPSAAAAPSPASR